MHTVILGAGQVGLFLAQALRQRGHAITLIEQDEHLCAQVDAQYDVRVAPGNGASARVLSEAAVGECDAFLAMTAQDRSNMMACSLAKALGAQQTLCRIHNHTYEETSLINYQLHFGIDELINPEALTAMALTAQIRSPDRVALERFSRGQIGVNRILISRASPYAHQRLVDIHFPEGVRLLYVERGGEIILPTRNTFLQEGDWGTFIGNNETLAKLTGLLSGQHKNEAVRVVLYGAQETGCSIVSLLGDRRYRVRVIDEDAERCAIFARQCPSVTVVSGDARSLRLLEEESVGNADYFIACSKNDESNIIVALQAAHLGARHTQLVLNNPDYEPILEELRSRLALQQMVSPRLVMAAQVLRLLSLEPYTELSRVPGEGAKLIEIRVSLKSPAVGRMIKEVDLLQPTQIALLAHKFNSILPGATDVILAGDRLVLLTVQDHIAELVQIFNP